ncbi:Uu.00g044620.m01.CDS01 [Anthostomella pinea]|uniref:Uu.00g044620.m01.CDS01 n=1 Tax=Anthostomella pinea TaxID=933095 RepID=A0AAI8VAW8_9PEZI|nr:Uu.00g044620.m01.CDS01 [Anthostomella pinea]
MSTNVSSSYDRKIYNDTLWKRHGAPSSLDDYLFKAQIMDYEATRAQFEAVSSFWNTEWPATGLIYWRLNNALPSLHWNLFDYSLHPAGTYYGAKVGARKEHLAYDYLKKGVYLINHTIDQNGSRKAVTTEPNTNKHIIDLSKPLKSINEVTFLRLTLQDGKQATLSRNVYWLAKTIDTLDWDSSGWFYTPVTEYADFTSLNKLQTANISVSCGTSKGGFNLVTSEGADVPPVMWSDNYVTLWPHEKLEVHLEGMGDAAVEISGKNIGKTVFPLQ